MPDAYALTEATYDRFNRAASRVLNKSDGGGPQFQGVTNPIEILQIQSGTIGTYGYPAKVQLFNTTTGAYADDAERPTTVYVIDPAGGTFAASQFVSGMFAGYRGAAAESVYVYVPATIPDTSRTVAGKVNLTSGQWLGAGQKYVEILGIGYNSGSPYAKIIATGTDGEIELKSGNGFTNPNGRIKLGKITAADTNVTTATNYIQPYDSTTMSGGPTGKGFLVSGDAGTVSTTPACYLLADGATYGKVVSNVFSHWNGTTLRNGVFDITFGTTYGGLQVAGGLIVGGAINNVPWSSIVSAPVIPFSNYSASTTPGASNDITQGYQVGSSWVRTTGGSESVWVCCNASTGAAVWKQTG